jgi:hypothetical protein
LSRANAASKKHRKSHRHSAPSKPIPRDAKKFPPRPKELPRKTNAVPPPLDRFVGKKGIDLARVIREAEESGAQRSYKDARQLLFGEVWRRADGKVPDVYGGQPQATDGIPSPNGPNGRNTEHVTPRSWGVRGTRFETWLHNLAPSDTEFNGLRGSLPFGFVEKVEFEKNGSKIGLDARGVKVAQPPPEWEGDLARKRLYTAIERGEFEGAAKGRSMDKYEFEALCKMADRDPVSTEEQLINARIAAIEGETNVLVLYSDKLPNGQDLEDFLQIPGPGEALGGDEVRIKKYRRRKRDFEFNYLQSLNRS